MNQKRKYAMKYPLSLTPVFKWKQSLYVTLTSIPVVGMTSLYERDVEYNTWWKWRAYILDSCFINTDVLRDKTRIENTSTTIDVRTSSWISVDRPS